MDWFKYDRDLLYFFISKLFSSKPESSKKCSILKNVENEKKKKEKEVTTGGFCKKKCSWKFRKFHRKTPVLESRFDKVAGLSQETLTQVFSCEICKIFKNTYFEEHMQTPSQA